MTDYAHVSWCIGTHDPDGECIIVRALVRPDEDPVEIVLHAIPCDTANLVLPDYLFDEVAARWVASEIMELLPYLVQGSLEASCVGHDHGEDDDDEDLPDDDEDDDVDCCSGCGQPNTDGLVGSDPDSWLCRSCCAARGLDWFTRRLGA